MLETFADQVDALHREGRVLARVAERDLSKPIPTCPGWDMRTLLVHVGTFHGWVAQMLRDRAAEPRRPPEQTLPVGAEPIAWYRARLDDLVAALGEIDPDTSMWTITTNQRARAWALRQAAETAVHCWDARAALGEPSEIENAASYLVEWLGSAVPYIVPFLDRTPPEDPLGIHLTDHQVRWVLARSNASVELRSSEDSPPTILTGTASEVLLALGGRPSRAELSGQQATFDGWRELLR